MQAEHSQHPRRAVDYTNGARSALEKIRMETGDAYCKSEPHPYQAGSKAKYLLSMAVPMSVSSRVTRLPLATVRAKHLKVRDARLPQPCE